MNRHLSSRIHACPSAKTGKLNPIFLVTHRCIEQFWIWLRKKKRTEKKESRVFARPCNPQTSTEKKCSKNAKQHWKIFFCSIQLCSVRSCECSTDQLEINWDQLLSRELVVRNDKVERSARELGNSCVKCRVVLVPDTDVGGSTRNHGQLNGGRPVATKKAAKKKAAKKPAAKKAAKKPAKKKAAKKK